jgi:anti-sigma factor (TIGR02949 family)
VGCEGNGRLLHGYFDGELDLVRAVEFEEHLKTCPDCARELREQQVMRQSLRSSNLYERAPESLRARIKADLPGATAVQPKLIPIRRRPVLDWLAVAAAIVFAVVLGARVIPNIGGQRQASLLSQEIVASHIRALQPGHLFDVQSTDQHTVKPWFDGKLDFAPPVTDLAKQGFPLVGGRLDYLDNRDVAALVYQRQKHLINVFIWPVESRPTKLAETQTIQGYNLVFWWRDGMDFCAASDLNVDELREFVQLLER